MSERESSFFAEMKQPRRGRTYRGGNDPLE
jgi:hypothetical protein